MIVTPYIFSYTDLYGNITHGLDLSPNIFEHSLTVSSHWYNNYNISCVLQESAQIKVEDYN